MSRFSEMRDCGDENVLRQVLGDFVVVRAAPEVPEHLGAMEANGSVGEIHPIRIHAWRGLR